MGVVAGHARATDFFLRIGNLVPFTSTSQLADVSRPRFSLNRKIKHLECRAP